MGSSGGELIGAQLIGAVVARLELSDAAGIDIKADNGISLGKGRRQRQADIAKTDDGDLWVFSKFIFSSLRV